MKKGFTLIELMIVIGITLLISAIALPFSFSDYKNASFRENRDLIVSMIQKARNRSINNICAGNCADGKTHGIRIETDKIILFQGIDYTSRDSSFDEVLDIKAPLKITGDQEVVFEKLTAKTTSAWSANLSDDTGKNSTIDINTEGQITWTN